MTKEELEKIVMNEKVMTMRELIAVLRREGMPMDRDAIITLIAGEQMAAVPDKPVSKVEAAKFIRNFSTATAHRQIEKIRAGEQVNGPLPNTLERNQKVFYPRLEVAAVMYIQAHSVTMYGKPSLRRILETRHLL